MNTLQHIPSIVNLQMRIEKKSEGMPEKKLDIIEFANVHGV